MTYIDVGGSYREDTDSEIEFLQSLAAPALVPTTTREFAKLNKLGLIFLKDTTGQAELTPLGKAWFSTQQRWP